MTTFYIPTGPDGKIETPGDPGTLIDLDVTTSLSMTPIAVGGQIFVDGFGAWETVGGTTARAAMFYACSGGLRVFEVTGTVAGDGVLSGPLSGWDLIGSFALTVTGELNSTLVATWADNCIEYMNAHPSSFGSLTSAGAFTTRGGIEWDALS